MIKNASQKIHYKKVVQQKKKKDPKRENAKAPWKSGEKLLIGKVAAKLVDNIFKFCILIDINSLLFSTKTYTKKNYKLEKSGRLNYKSLSA